MRILNYKLALMCLLFSAIFSFVSCKKEEHYYPIQDSFKEWTVFKTGSYWIFYDSETNKNDSSFVYENPVSYIYRDGGSIPYEVISFLQWNIGDFRIGGSQENNSILVNKEGYGGTLLSYYATANISNYISYACRVIDRFDTLTLLGNTFHSVIHIRNRIQDATGYDSIGFMDYYFAKNIGVIKASIKTSTVDSTLTLVRWHIVQ
jgi:hypothetical protein